MGPRCTDLPARVTRWTRSQNDHRQRPGFRGAPDTATHLDARDQRQHPIEENEIGFAFSDLDERLLPVAGFTDLKAFLLEVVAQQCDQRRLVFDHQNERLCHDRVSFGVTISRLETSPFGRTSSRGVPLTR